MPVVFISLAPGLSDDDTGETPGDAPVKPAAGAEPEVPCTWCGFMSTAGPACDRCGSPLPTSYAMTTDGSLVATRKKKVPPVVTIASKGTTNLPGKAPGQRQPPPDPAPHLDWEHDTVVHTNGNGAGRPAAIAPTEAPPADVPPAEAAAAVVEAPAPTAAAAAPVAPVEVSPPVEPDASVADDRGTPEPVVTSAHIALEPPAVGEPAAPEAPPAQEDESVFDELWGHAAQVEEAGTEELSIQAIDAASQLAFEDRDRTYLAGQRATEDSPARPVEAQEATAPELGAAVEVPVADPIDVADPEPAVDAEPVVEPEPVVDVVPALAESVEGPDIEDRSRDTAHAIEATDTHQRVSEHEVVVAEESPPVGGGLVGDSLTALFQEAGLEAPATLQVDAPEAAPAAAEVTETALSEVPDETLLPTTRRADRHRRLWKRDRKGEPRGAADAPAAEATAPEAPPAQAPAPEAPPAQAPAPEAPPPEAQPAEASAPPEPQPQALEPDSEPAASATAEPVAVEPIPEATQLDPSPADARPGPAPAPRPARRAATATRAQPAPQEPSKPSRTRPDREPSPSVPQVAAAELAALAAPAPATQQAAPPPPHVPSMAETPSVPAPVAPSASPRTNGSSPADDQGGPGVESESPTVDFATSEAAAIEAPRPIEQPPALIAFPTHEHDPAVATNGHAGAAATEAATETTATGGRMIACRSCGQPSERGICDVCGEALREMHELSQGLW
jgi:nicotinate-nucleotide--dimethylbenzimidazole phosphoribosyltransferase